MNNNTTVLTVSDLTALSEVARAAMQSAKLTYMSEDGNIVNGEARAFVQDPSRPVFLAAGQDVRDAYLWVTAGGFEVFPSVRHLMKMVREGGFVIES
jgi:hypothetical protein